MKPTLLLPVIAFALMPLTINAGQHDNNNDKVKNGDPTQIILQDHKKIKKMIGELSKELDSSDSKQSRDTFKNFSDFIKKHETMEQEVFYPDLEKHDELKSTVQHLIEQEKQASDEISNIDGIDDDKQWKSEVKKLIKNVKQHASDEENKLFPKVRKTLDKSTQQEISNKLMEYRKDKDM